jgi:primosomal protein N' (replication factor Y)
MAHKGALILGSATPSVTSYERAKEGIYQLIELKERYNRTPLPIMETVDMRNELRNGNRSIFSRKLMELMEDALDKGRQVILLQNRRGYSNFISCRECGYVAKCPTCGLALTYHRGSGRLVCHYCGHEEAAPETCPECITVREFARRYPKGTYVIGTGSHAVCVKDGDWIDLFNSGDEAPMYFYRKKEKEYA